MKNIIRAFVAALVLTGSVATAHSATKNLTTSTATLSALPTPVCPPGDPNGCGINGTTTVKSK